MEELELRMYFFVPYNISPIQQAIQAGHAALEYAVLHGQTHLFKKFAKDHKTWIILNGGTTNNKLLVDGTNYQGTLNQLKNEIIQWNFEHRLEDNLRKQIEYGEFYEPDLNDALTAICFICDQRVWDRELVPDFPNYILDHKMYPEAKAELEKNGNLVLISSMDSDQQKEFFPEYYEEWRLKMGEEKNIFLRELLRGKPLA